MKELQYNRKAAKVVLVIVIILSLVLGCNRSVHRLENAATDAYTNGTQAYGTPINDVAAYTRNGEELYAIAEVYGYATENFKTGLDTLKVKGGSVTAVQGPLESVKYEAEQAYGMLLAGSDVPQYDRDAAIMYMTQMEGALYKLKGNVVYAEAAESYNKAIKALLPKIIMHSAQPAVLFN